MSIGLSHSNGNAVATSAWPQFRNWLILWILFCESKRTSRMVSCVNSPKIIAPS